MHFDNTHHCSPPMILLRPVTKYLPPTSRSFNKKTCHWVQLVFPRCAQTQSKGHDPEGNGLPLSSHLLPLGPQTQSFASSSPIHSGILTDWVLCSSSVGNCTCCTLLSTKALSRRHCSVAVQCDSWSYHLCFSFFTFLCVFRHIPGQTMCASDFSRFSFSLHYLGGTVCFSHFSSF